MRRWLVRPTQERALSGRGAGEDKSREFMTKDPHVLDMTIGGRAKIGSYNWVIKENGKAMHKCLPEVSHELNSHAGWECAGCSLFRRPTNFSALLNGLDFSNFLPHRQCLFSFTFESQLASPTRVQSTVPQILTRVNIFLEMSHRGGRGFYIRSQAHPKLWVNLRAGESGAPLIGQVLSKMLNQKVCSSIPVLAYPCR